MLPDRVSNPGPLTYKSGALPTALRGPANSDADWTTWRNWVVVVVCVYGEGGGGMTPFQN